MGRARARRPVSRDRIQSECGEQESVRVVVCSGAEVGAGAVAGAVAYNYERQSHGTLKAQSLTSSGCCAFFPGVDQIVEQGCFGAPVFIDGLAPPSVGVMSVLVPMENVVALQVSMLLLVLLLSVTRLVLVLLPLLLTMFVWVLGL